MHRKTDVRDLKISDSERRIKMRNFYAYEFRTLCFNADSRSCSLADALPLGLQIQRGVQGQALWSSTAVDLHGICSINLAQWASGYRSVPKCETRRALSSGLSGTGSQIDLGRCQRNPRLETLGGFGKKPDQPSSKALSRRDLGVGLGQYDLRSGFFNHRSDDVGVSVGKVSLNKKRNQTSHAIGFKGPNSHLHLHFRRETQRCKLLGHADFRTRSHIHHGQGVYRLGETVSNCKRRGILCDSGQGQSAIYQIQVAIRRQGNRIAQRPNRETLDSQIQRGFPHLFKESSLLRRRKEKALNIFDEQLADNRFDCVETLQKALGDRVVFQVDQRQSGNQALLWNKPECGEDANLDSRFTVFNGGHPSQKPKTARKPSQYSADFECSPI